MGVSDRDPLFFPPGKQDGVEDPENRLPEVDPAAQEKRLRAIVLLAAIFVVLVLFSARSGPLRGAWDHFSASDSLRGAPVTAPNTRLSDEELRDIQRMPPQRQAERLLERAINRYDGVLPVIESSVDSWQGSLRMDSRLQALVTAALNSNDLRVRSVGIEVDLASYRLPKTSASVDRVVGMAESDAQGRPWALYTLGLLGNRQVEPDRARQTLLSYLHHPDENTRVWAVEGLGFLGSEDVLAPLLEVMHNDPSPKVRERAACNLAQSGMLAPELRRRAIPDLLDYAEDSSLDPQTRGWAFQALRDITGQALPNDPAPWRAWYSAQTTR